MDPNTPVQIVYSTYTPAQKASIARYRSTENGRLKHCEASRRYYQRRKAARLASIAEESPPVSSDDEAAAVV